MSYCLYLRKSRADAEAEALGEGETLARHEKTLLDLAKKLRLNITQIHREIVSGETIASRPVMQQLLSEVEQGLWQGVLVMEIERLARGDTIDQGIVAQAFKLSDTRIITPVKTYDPNDEFDEEYFEFGLFMSRREYKTINRRLQRGRITSVKEGKYVANTPPFGYTRVKLEHEKGFTLAPIPEEAEAVRLIYELYTVGDILPDGSKLRLGVSRIVRKLNDLKILPKKGKDWTTASVRDILKNPVYIGKIRWNWRPAVKKIADGAVSVERPRSSAEDCIIVDGLHPPIISEETFNLAQEYMKLNPPAPVGARNTVKNPLCGLIICGKCGRRMTRRPYGTRQEPSLLCSATLCDNVSSDLRYVEQRVLDGLAEWLEEYKLQWQSDTDNNASKIPHKEKAKKRILSDIATLNRQLDNIHDLLEQGVYTTEKFLERSQHIAERLKENQETLETIEKEIALDKAREKSKIDIIPKVEHLLSVYHQLPDAKAKNDMLKNVLEKAVYIKTNRARWHGSPDDFSLTLYPKLPTDF